MSCLLVLVARGTPGTPILVLVLVNDDQARRNTVPVEQFGWKHDHGLNQVGLRKAFTNHLLGVSPLTPAVFFFCQLRLPAEEDAL
jgi:hypothetical protein